jgi:hypothetical protein
MFDYFKAFQLMDALLSEFLHGFYSGTVNTFMASLLFVVADVFFNHTRCMCCSRLQGFSRLCLVKLLALFLVTSHCRGRCIFLIIPNVSHSLLFVVSEFLHPKKS